MFAIPAIFIWGVLGLVVVALLYPIVKAAAKAAVKWLFTPDKIPNVTAVPLPKAPQPETKPPEAPPSTQPEAEPKKEPPKEEPPKKNWPIPILLPDPKGNTGSDEHEGKEKKENCDEELKKYPVHAYGARDETKNRLENKQSHHVMQHALFMDQKNTMPSSLAPPTCDSYTENAAPCIALSGGTKQAGTPHARVTAMQREQATTARATGVPYTYGDARKNAETQLKAAKLTEKEIRCVMAVVDAWMLKLCPLINEHTIVRTPWYK